MKCAFPSRALALRTVLGYGDVTGFFTGQPPDNDRNFKDISAVVRGFQSVQAEPKVWLDLRGTSNAQVPDFSAIDFQDIDRAVKGFQNGNYLCNPGGIPTGYCLPQDCPGPCSYPCP